MKLGIIDYGIGNLRSVEWAFEHLGAQPVWVRNQSEFKGFDQLILPGVGAFSKGVEELKSRQLFEPVQDWLQNDRPFLGICVGFQLLFSRSSEGSGADGFGHISGKVTRLTKNGGLKIPQIGWNDLSTDASEHGPLTQFAGQYFYFVHSYAAPTGLEIPHATTTYGTTFTSAVIDGNVWGTQFHPERSGSDGLAFLKTFLEVTG